MRNLSITSLMLLALLAQSGGQPVNIPISQTSFEFGYGQSLAQDLHVTPLHFQPYGGNGFYTIQFSASNPLNNYPGEWEVELTFGTQTLCDHYGWATGPVIQHMEICGSPGYLIVDQALPGGGPAKGANNLVLTFTVNDGSFNGGWPVEFDNVSLTFTPSS